MAEAQVKFFSQRLGSLLVQRADLFRDGVQDQLGRIQSALHEIGGFLGSESEDGIGGWASEVQDLCFNMDDLVDQFIIQMHQQDGKELLRESFKCELQKTESRLEEMVHRKHQPSHPPENETQRQEAGKEPYQEIVEAETNEEGQTSGETSDESRSMYTSLHYYLQSCLLYCCIFPEGHWVSKGKLIRLLVAEGLVQEVAGRLPEELAGENIDELIARKMIYKKNEHPGHGTNITVASSYRAIVRERFISTHPAPNSTIPSRARRVLTPDMPNIAETLKDTRPRTLFSFGKQDHLEGNWLSFPGAKFLRVLDLEGAKIKSIPDELGDLIHLTYLGLKHNDIADLPVTISNLNALETLDIRWCGRLTSLSGEILNLIRLKHIKMFKNMGVRGMKLPEGIARFTDLLTLTGVHGGGDFPRQLSGLRKLRRLGVMDVTEDIADQLFASITALQSLISLSLEAKCNAAKEKLTLLESFSPPPLLQKLRLEGRLEKIPNWFHYLNNLRILRLGFSHLEEDPGLVLQLLPSLQNLTLWQACDAKHLGKEFCKVGGFPKLEILVIASHMLEEWTEVEEGAFPSLQYLHIHNCSRLRMLPEGLQFVTTLKQFDLLPVRDELVQKLKPDGGEENYKISHIPNIRFIPVSALNFTPPNQSSNEGTPA
ncbi:Putative disease resistance protein At1g58400 [Linum grandiflorum]